MRRSSAAPVSAACARVTVSSCTRRVSRARAVGRSSQALNRPCACSAHRVVARYAATRTSPAGTATHAPPPSAATGCQNVSTGPTGAARVLPNTSTPTAVHVRKISP